MKRILLLLLAASACGGVGGGPCPTAGATVCSKACACRSDAKCTVLIPAAAGSSSLTLASPNDCAALYQLACNNSPAAHTVDFAACQSGLQTAACAPDPNAPGGQQGLALPAACAPLW